MSIFAAVAVLSLLTGESQVKVRPGTKAERGDRGVVIVHNDGTYAWPGIGIRPADGGTWDLSSAGVLEVTVSNCSDRTEMIHATVLGRGFGLDKSPARSTLAPPHGVRTISVQIADEFCVTDEPVTMGGMKGRVRAKSELLDFSATTSVEVYQTLGDSHRKTAFAVLDVKTAFAARQPKVLAATNFFPFVDRYGQFKHGEWKGKIHSDEELQRVKAREEKWLAEHAEGPVADVDQYGGWLKGPQLKATGFFRTEKVAGKWWLVDPEGHVFFSLGIDCVYSGNSTVIDGERKSWFEWLPKPGTADCDGLWFDKESNHQVFNFIEANLVRKYGKKWQPHFNEMVHRRFRAWGVNTIGNWSGSRTSRLGRFPYVGTIHPSSSTRLKTKDHPEGVYVPDVWSDQFVKDVDRNVASLAKTVKDDPWCVGVYIDNELMWYLVDKPGEVAEKYFSVVSAAMNRHLPNHLYLGCRFWWGNEDVWRAAARHCDVVSFNFYERHPTKDLPVGSVDKPIIVGEFHFGAKDRGQFVGGCAETFDQQERARCFTRYVNDCLDNPRYVGCHWFQYQDQPLTGRPDGENYNDGFVSVCDFPYPELVEACRRTAAQMYMRKAFGDVRAVAPAPQSRDPDNWWVKRFAEKQRLVEAGGSQVVFIGDSITHFWESTGRVYWERFFAGEPYKALNLGMGGDRTEHVLWRIDHGELDGYEAKVVVLMIGTNNTGQFTEEKEPVGNTVIGIRTVLDRIRAKQPKAKIVLCAIFPRGHDATDDNRRRNNMVNSRVRHFADGKNIFWCDFNDQFLKADGTLPTEMFPDGLHPNYAGYKIWAKAVLPYIQSAVNDRPMPTK